jgi:hypothetical protein
MIHFEIIKRFSDPIDAERVIRTLGTRTSLRLVFEFDETYYTDAFASRTLNELFKNHGIPHLRSLYVVSNSPTLTEYLHMESLSRLLQLESLWICNFAIGLRFVPISVKSLILERCYASFPLSIMCPRFMAEHTYDMRDEGCKFFYDTEGWYGAMVSNWRATKIQRAFRRFMALRSRKLMFLHCIHVNDVAGGEPVGRLGGQELCISNVLEKLVAIETAGWHRLW